MAEITIGTLSNGEIQAINSLEAELIEMQLLENRLQSIDGRNPIQRIVDFFAVKPSLYSDPKRMKTMITELETYLKTQTKTQNIRGRVLGKSAVEAFMSNSERKNVTQKALALITRSNERQALRRLEVSLMELKKEAAILTADIDIFMANAKIAGFSNKETLAQLVRAAGDKDGIAQGFAKRVKSVTTAAIRRERSSSEIDEFKKVALEDEDWQWITISTKPCPDCEARAGKVMKLHQWEKLGLPGSGRTICGKYCRCKLMPFSISEERFKTVKVFDFDKNNLVLTTASEERILKAKKHQPPQKEPK
jgi:hypothetical protein